MDRRAAIDASAQRTQADAPAFLRLFLAVMLPMFLAAVDQTVLATATPTIVRELGGLRDAAWISVGYLIAATVMVPVYGRIGDRYGRRETLLWALAGFSVGSVACAAAPSLPLLALARVLQGLGGGGLMVMCQALIGELVPPRERARYQGYFGAVFSLANVGGPLLGGLVVSHASWRWLFLANLPLCALAAWRIASLPPGRRNPGAAALEDGTGIALFAAAATASLLWLGFVGHRFAWTSATNVVLAAGCAALWVLLVRRERRAPVPFLPVELLRIPGIRRMGMVVACFAACLFAMVFFFPVYLQLGHQVAATGAGLLLLPLSLGVVSGSTLTGRIVARTGRPAGVPVFGLALAGCCLLLLGLLQPSMALMVVLGAGCGIGFGTVMPVAQILVQSLAGRERLGAASSIVSLARSAGGALGTAGFGALVFALLGIGNLDALLQAGRSGVAAVGPAFHSAFIGAGMLALLGAWVASRLPRVQL